MEKIHALPKEIKEALAEAGISEESVIVWARADMDAACEYRDTYLAVTDRQLAVAVMPAAERPAVTLRGYYAGGRMRRRMAQFEGKTPQQVQLLDIAALSEPKGEALVAGGLFLLKENGAEKCVCAFSASVRQDLLRLIDCLRHRIDGSEWKPEETEQEERCPKCGMLYPEKERRICPHCMDKRSIFMRILGYFKPYRKQAAVMLACMLLSTAAGLMLPYLSGTVLFDGVLARSESAAQLLGAGGDFALALVILCVLLVVMRLLQTGLTVLQGRMVAKIVPNMMLDIKSGIFDAVGRLSVSFFARRQTGGLMTRINNDATNVMYFFIDCLPFMVTNLLTILISGVMMFCMDWKLALVSVALFPVLFVISFRLMPVLWSYYGRRWRASRELNARMNDNLTGARVVKAFGKEKQELRRFEKVNRRVRESELDLVKFDNRFYAMYVAVEQLALLLVWGVGSMMLLGSGRIGYGMLVSFVGYASGLSNPMDFLSYAFREWSNSMNSAQRIFEILDAVPEITEAESPVALPEIKGRVSFENVCFSYEAGKEILKGVSFTAESGQMLGIVGHSGAGKSTIVNLISRLYDVSGGEVLLDGVDVRKLPLRQLRQSVAMVSQETYIFMGTIYENIAYAKPEAEPWEVLAAARAASAHEFIMRLPDGYDTVIGA
ncbi:MAG: ABC transporter ATP-binding protein, partial [Clostridiales bacterium]|nr:ABC transporter ATP-binding protein [Clostridiales bacterium]